MIGTKSYHSLNDRTGGMVKRETGVQDVIGAEDVISRIFHRLRVANVETRQKIKKPKCNDYPSASWYGRPSSDDFTRRLFTILLS